MNIYIYLFLIQQDKERFKNSLNNDSVLAKMEIISGVLKGSMLGLFLFTLFLRDLGKGVNTDTVCYWYKLILKSTSKTTLKTTEKTLNKIELLRKKSAAKPTTTINNNNKEIPKQNIKIKIDKCK